MKILLQLFVETENIGKAINALSEGGITGFYLMEYKGMSPQDWSGFLLDEDPENALKIINDIAINAVMIGTIIDEKHVNKIKECLDERLQHERYTIIEVPIEGLKVNRTD
jgi:nitrogen regulatory protein PII-like uncharacterized protein